MQPGAKYVIALATHALGFDKEDPEDPRGFVQKLNESSIDELIVCNSVFRFYERVLADPELQKKVSVLDVSPYLGTVVDRLSGVQTIREMMRELEAEDLYRVAFASEQARLIERSI